MSSESVLWSKKVTVGAQTPLGGTLGDVMVGLVLSMDTEASACCQGVKVGIYYEIMVKTPLDL